MLNYVYLNVLSKFMVIHVIMLTYPRVEYKLTHFKLNVFGFLFRRLFFEIKNNTFCI